MSLSYGFYNSLNGDRKYDAKQISELFDGLIHDGIFASIGTCFVVHANSGLQVNVGVGRAWFNHTWLYNDSIMAVDMPDSDVLLNRIDAVVIEVDSSEPVRANSIKVVQGVTASSPANPTLVNTATKHQYALCYIYRAAGSTEVLEQDITNNVGSTETPFVTGVNQAMDINELMTQWDAYVRSTFDTMHGQQAADWDNWFAAIQVALDGSTAGNLLAEINRARNGIIYDCSCSYATNVYSLTISNAPIAPAALPSFYSIRFKTPNAFVEGSTFKIGGVDYTASFANIDTPLTAAFFLSGKVITAEVDEVAKTINFKSGSGADRNFSLYIFTSTATLQIPAAAKKVDVCCIGAGGHGGAGSGGTYQAGGGGGGSGFIQNFYNIAVTPGQSYTATVGSGSSGGYSQFGSATYRANGGSNGLGFASGAAGAGGDGGAGGGGGGATTGFTGAKGGNGYNTTGGAASTFYGGGGGGYGGTNGSVGSGTTGGAAGIPPHSDMWFPFDDPTCPICIFPRGGGGGGAGNSYGGQKLTGFYAKNDRLLNQYVVIAYGAGGDGSASGTTSTTSGTNGCVIVRIWW